MPDARALCVPTSPRARRERREVWLAWGRDRTTTESLLRWRESEWEGVVGKLKKNRGGVYWKPLVGKTFQTVAFEWSSIVRRTPLPRFTMLGFIGHTHAPRSSLALSFPPFFFFCLHLIHFFPHYICSRFKFPFISFFLSFFLSFLFIQFIVNLSSTISPRRFLQRKCNRAIKLCFSANFAHPSPLF